MDFPPYGPADLAAKMDHVEDRLTAIFERLFDLYEVRPSLPTLPFVSRPSPCAQTIDARLKVLEASVTPPPSAGTRSQGSRVVP